MLGFLSNSHNEKRAGVWGPRRDGYWIERSWEIYAIPLVFFLLILLFLDEQLLAINNIHTRLRDTLHAAALQVVDRYCWSGLESV